MFSRFSGKERKIVAGVRLPADHDYIKSVISLAQRTQMSLRFVHVVEPWNAAGATYPEGYLLANIATLGEEERIQDASARLQDGLRTYLDDYKFETATLAGQPAEMIRSDALSARASLIVAGVKSASHRFVPKGFSTAVGLMAESSIPILSLPEGRFFNFASGRMTIMVADDLTQTSADVVPTVAELAGALKNVEIIHFHAHPETAEKLSLWAEQISQMMITRDLEYDFPLDCDTILNDTEKEITNKLKRRIEVPLAYLESNDVAYTQKVTFGEVATELSDIVSATKPNLIAFGRHHFLHKHPLSIGKLPFYSMLSLETPVLVVSNVARLA